MKQTKNKQVNALWESKIIYPKNPNNSTTQLIQPPNSFREHNF